MIETASNTGYAPVNGLKMYYEIHGEGMPLIVIHGGFGSTGMLGPVVPQLAKTRQVIAVDMQGHGRTGDIDRPLEFDLLASDIAALAGHLKHSRVDVMGYSLGGAVALHTAINYPDTVRKLVVVSEAFRSDGWYPEVLAGFKRLGTQSAEQLRHTPLYSAYCAVSPNPEDWSALHDKYRCLLAPEYDWSDDVAGMDTTPALIVFGDADAIQPSHAVEFFELLGGGRRDGGWDGSGIPKSRLAILPGETHYNLLSAPLLSPIVAAFLDE